jgi:hypothetical protein
VPWDEVVTPQWLAGFFDGEGCISCTVAGKARRVILRLSLVNTDYALMRLIATQYHGQFVYRKAAKATWKRACHVVWTNTQATELLKQIGSLLMLKRRQAELAQEFLALRDDPNRFVMILHATNNKRSNVGPHRRISPEMLEKEEKIKQEFHRLNAKGAAA